MQTQFGGPAPMDNGAGSWCRCKIEGHRQGGGQLKIKAREAAKAWGKLVLGGTEAQVIAQSVVRAVRQQQVRGRQERPASANARPQPRHWLPQGPPDPTAAQRWGVRPPATRPGPLRWRLQASGARRLPLLLGVRPRYGCWVQERKNMTCRGGSGSAVGAGLQAVERHPSPATLQATTPGAPCRRTHHPRQRTTAVMLSCEPRAYASMHSARAAYSAPAPRHLSASRVASSLSMASHSPSLASTSTRLAAVREHKCTSGWREAARACLR